MSKSSGFTTRILHADREGGVEHGSLHKPIHTSVAFGFERIEDLVDVFQGTQPGYSYGRQSNPTVDALAHKITLMEGGIGTLCFATGMGAIGTLLLALLKQGDHVVSSAYLFGNTNSLFGTFDRLGLDVTFVDATDARQVRAAVRPDTRLVFTETIANPRTQIADLEGIGALCKELGLLYVVDNTMTSPWLFQPRTVGAGMVINALTKYIGGHGMALGGAVTDTGLFDWTAFDNILEMYRDQPPARQGLLQLRKKGLRDLGATLMPETAHHIAVGAETLALRMDRACANAGVLADYLHGHPRVQQVYYPGLAGHAQHDRAQRLFRHPGALLSFVLDADIDIYAFMNRLQVIVSSTNLGDTRTLAIPVAPTIYHEMGKDRRAEIGIAESLIRFSVGIEDVDDLLADIGQALDAC